MEVLIGAVSGALFLAGYWRLSDRAVCQGAVIAFAVMLAIYVGAHLAVSDLPRVLGESALGLTLMALALYAQLRYPRLLGALVLGHGVYDGLLGSAAGVASWYPPLCVGFDVVVGVGLLIRLPPRTVGTSPNATDQSR